MKKKECSACKEVRFLYARGMCLGCDRRKNPHKHGGRFKKTKKQESKDRRMKAAKSAFVEDKCWCEGCGKWNEFLGVSHRLPARLFEAYADDPDNFDLMCHKCHDNVECFRFNLLINGQEIEAYIKKQAPEWYVLRKEKTKWI